MINRDDFIRLVVDYSDLSAEERDAVFRRSQFRVRRHVELKSGVTETETYKIASGTVLSAEHKGHEVLDYALSLDHKPEGRRSLLERLRTDFDEADIGVVNVDSSEALDYLSKKLTFEEYAFIVRLFFARTNDGADGFHLTKSYVKRNLDHIKRVCREAMSFYPYINGEKRFHKLDMDSAVESYVVGVYGDVKLGLKKRFPHGFFSKENQRNSRVLTRFLVEEILRVDQTQVTMEQFQDQGLGWMISTVYQDSPFNAIVGAYPEFHFNPWDFSKVPRGYWEGEQGRQNAVNAVKWLIERRLALEDITQITTKDFHDANLGSMLSHTYDGSVTTAVIDAYPERFKLGSLTEFQDFIGMVMKERPDQLKQLNGY